MFEDIRRSLDELLQRATKPEEHRSTIARMKDTLVQATVSLDEMRDALSFARKKLEAEQSELATVRRRKELAVGINDTETMAVAERFEKQHAEKAAVLEAKIAAQTRELELAEAEVSEMKQELRLAAARIPGTPGVPSSAPPAEDPLGDDGGAATREEIDALARQRARADRDAEAQSKLDELKKRMGK